MVVDDRLLQPGPIQRVRVDVTSRCNLRCVYCAVSHPDYRGEDMKDATTNLVVALILKLARHNRLDPIDLNGHGETTFRKGWNEICLALIERGLQVRLTSNFARAFDEDELEALASMESIAISIDTADRALLQRVRRRVDLRQIVTNMALVRATAVKLHHTPPKFGFLCGVYDKSALDWDNFARLAIALDVAYVHIWSLTTHPNLDVPEGERVRPLDDLSDDELRPRVLSVLRGLNLLQRHDVEVTVQGGFIETLAKRIGVDATGRP